MDNRVKVGNFVIQAFYRSPSKNWGVQVLNDGDVSRSNIDRSFAPVHEWIDCGFDSLDSAINAGIAYAQKL